MARFRPNSVPLVTLDDVDQRADGRPGTALTNRSTALTVVSLVLLVALAGTRRQDLVNSFRVLIGLAPIPFLVAVGLSVVGMINRAGQFRSAHRLAGIDTDLRSMGRISAAGYALNKVVKTGGLGGVALFVRHGRRRGLPAGSILAAYLVSSLSSQLALVTMVGVAVVALTVSASTLGPWAATAAIVALVILIGLPTIAAVCFRSRTLVERWFQVPFDAADRVTARLGRRSLTRPDPAHIDRFYDTIGALRRNPAASLPVLAHALAAKLIGAAVLTTALVAVGAEISPGAALLVYILALVAAASTFLPGGVGAVEATMTVMLAGYGVPMTTALAGTIAFRLLDMWLPILVGLLVAPGLDRSTDRARYRDRVRAQAGRPLTIEPATADEDAATDPGAVAVAGAVAPATTSGSSWSRSPRPGERVSALTWLHSTTRRSLRSNGPCTTTACWCSGADRCRTLTTTP